MSISHPLYTLLGTALLLPGLVLAAPDGSGRHRDHDFNPEMQRQEDGREEDHGMPHFLRGIDLSETQRDRLFELRHQQAPAIHAQKKALHQAREGLRELSQADRFDQDKAATLSRKMAEAGATLALLRAQNEHRAWALLTPDQRRQAARQDDGAAACRMQGKPEKAHFRRPA